MVNSKDQRQTLDTVVDTEISSAVQLDSVYTCTKSDMVQVKVIIPNQMR